MICLKQREYHSVILAGLEATHPTSTASTSWVALKKHAKMPSNIKDSVSPEANNSSSSNAPSTLAEELLPAFLKVHLLCHTFSGFETAPFFLCCFLFLPYPSYLYLHLVFLEKPIFLVQSVNTQVKDENTQSKHYADKC